MPESSFVELEIYDVFQKKVKTVFDDVVEAGRYEVSNDMIGYDSTRLGSGIYFIRMITFRPSLNIDAINAAPLFDDTIKMILLK